MSEKEVVMDYVQGFCVWSADRSEGWTELLGRSHAHETQFDRQRRCHRLQELLDHRRVVWRWCSPRLDNGSCVSREVHAQFCERVGVRLPRATPVILVKSPRAGQRVKASVTAFLARRLKLPVNEHKSKVARIS